MALIELEKIVKTYDLGHQKVPALRSIDVRIERNEFVAIVPRPSAGPSFYQRFDPGNCSSMRRGRVLDGLRCEC